MKRVRIDHSIEALYSEPRGRLTNPFRLASAVSLSFIEKHPLAWLSISPFSFPIAEKTIFHSSYYRISKSKKAINVVTVYDFTAERYFKGMRRYIHQKRKKNALLHGHGLICISHNTKSDLLRLYPFADEKKIRVIYCGVSNDFGVLPKSAIDLHFKYTDVVKGKPVLYVGSRASYKNFPIAAQAVSLLNDDFKLLIIGDKLSNKETAFLDKVLKNRYCCVTGIDHKTLNIFYNLSHCFIYPSGYEGFGIPLLEAMKAGCPVVTTNKSSIPEVVGEAAIMVDEISPAHFAEAILKLSDEQVRTQFIDRGLQQSTKFSWNKCYDEVKGFYKELYDSIP